MLVKNCFCFQEKEGAKEDDKPKFFTPAFLKLGQDAEKAQLETAKAQKAAEKERRKAAKEAGKAAAEAAAESDPACALTEESLASSANLAAAEA